MLTITNRPSRCENFTPYCSAHRIHPERGSLVDRRDDQAQDYIFQPGGQK